MLRGVQPLKEKRSTCQNRVDLHRINFRFGDAACNVSAGSVDPASKTQRSCVSTESVSSFPASELVLRSRPRPSERIGQSC